MRFVICLALALGCSCDRETPIEPEPVPSDEPPKPVVDEQALKGLGLSAEATDDVRGLLMAKAFGGIAVGDDGGPSGVLQALRRLVTIDGATKALTHVVDHGTVEGQLMALAGLYEVDRTAFDAAAPRFSGRRGRFDGVNIHMSGCSPDAPALIGDVVNNPGAVRLDGPTDNLASWHARNPGKDDAPIDIAGGGYASWFFHGWGQAPPSASSSAKH